MVRSPLPREVRPAARAPHPRLKAALTRHAENAEVARAVRDGAVIDEECRRRLADLLDIAGRADVRIGLTTHLNDKLAALTNAIDQAQRPATPPLRAPKADPSPWRLLRVDRAAGSPRWTRASR